jgi:hypothetical protein
MCNYFWGVLSGTAVDGGIFGWGICGAGRYNDMMGLRVLRTFGGVRELTILVWSDERVFFRTIR